MIVRMWRCYTTPENAGAFEALVDSDIRPRLEKVKGFVSGDLLRRDLLQEVEFVAISYYDSLDSVRSVTGEDFGQLLIPESALSMLIRFDKRASFYNVSRDLKQD
jgi:antibiotic biosynthesis monooxygenase